jgi:hypothetical protein
VGVVGGGGGGGVGVVGGGDGGGMGGSTTARVEGGGTGGLGCKLVDMGGDARASNTMSKGMERSGAPLDANCVDGVANERTANRRPVSNPGKKLAPGALNGSSEKYSCVVSLACPAQQPPAQTLYR